MKKTLLVFTMLSLIAFARSHADVSCLTDLDPTCSGMGLDESEAICPGSCYPTVDYSAGTEEFAVADDFGGLGNPPTPLQWNVFLPNDSLEHPAILLINVGCFKGVIRGPGCVAQDLASAGFVVLAIDYRGACS